MLKFKHHALEPDFLEDGLQKYLILAEYSNFKDYLERKPIFFLATNKRRI